jgi:glycosyltransferase involved in cell wall biosynthesis
VASRKIALFTPFHPRTGGGAVIFRSLLANLPDVEYRWFYLSNDQAAFPRSERLGPPVLGGPFLRDAVNSALLYCFEWQPSVHRYSQRILEWAPDVVWVNAMNEGLLMGKTLLRLGIPKLHVSVHDDPSGLAAKSHRYRHMTRVIDRCNRSLLHVATSVDVVSEAMRVYYKERYGIESEVIYRYLDPPAIARISLQTKPPEAPETILVGHVGSAYSLREVLAFLRALRLVENSNGVRFKVMAFGRRSAFEKFAEEFPGLIECAGEVAEPEVVERLRQCRFVYSMYSFNPRHRIFRETSQPTKISTYLMAATPIFFHCPDGSSTIQLMSQFQLGVCVSSLDETLIAGAVRRILDFQVDPVEVRRAAEFYCGTRNLTNLRRNLGLDQQI